MNDCEIKLYEIKKSMKENQKQTCGNFSELNNDIDDIRGHLVNIEKMLRKIIEGK